MAAKQKQQKRLANSFTVENKIEQAPESNILVRRLNGFKVISRGSDNLLPFRIANIVKGSSTLSNVIYSKAELVSNGEIDTDRKVLNKLSLDLNKDYNYSEFLKRLAVDYYTHGYGFAERVRVGKEVFIYHLPTEKVCFQEFENRPEYAVISKDWNKRSEKPFELPLYPNEIEEDGKYRSVLFFRDYDVNNSVYGLPKWVGAFYDAQVESLIGQYNANQFENGISLSSILSIDLGGEFNSSEELEKAKTKLEREIKGTSNSRSGKALIHAANGGVEAPTYTQFPMEKEGSFEKLQETTENNIITANSWFRSLSGKATAGTLGNTQQLRNEWALAERQIKNFQYKVTDVVLRALGLNVEYTFSNQTPIDLVGDYEGIADILKAKNEIGLNATIQLLVLMGIEKTQAEKMVNDSE